jgi:hypothetical protein
MIKSIFEMAEYQVKCGSSEDLEWLLTKVKIKVSECDDLLKKTKNKQIKKILLNFKRKAQERGKGWN